MTDLELIHSLIDGELEGETRQAAQERLFADPVFRAHYEQALALKSAVKEQCSGTMCEETWNMCRSRLDAIDQTSRAEAFIGRYAWQMAACLFMVLVGLGIFNRMNPSRSLRAADVASYTASLGTGGIVPNGVEDWLGRKLGVSIPEEQIQIVGYGQGRMADGRPIERVDLSDASGHMVLIVVNNTDHVEGTWQSGSNDYQRGTIGETNCIAWQGSNVVAFLVGNRSHEELQNVLDKLRVH